MRLWPRSLLVRLLLLLFIGLAGAQLLSAWILLQDRGQVLVRTVGDNIARRITAIVMLLDELSPAERRRIVAALDLPPTRISLDRPWLALAPDPAAVPFASRMQALLPAGRAFQVRVVDPEPPVREFQRAGRGPPMGRGMGMHRGFQFRAVQAQVMLADGGVVSFSYHLPEEITARPYRLWLMLAILLVSVLVLASLAVGILTRPLSWLAGAAAELGRDIRRPPLDERHGPLEVRHAARAFNTMQKRLQRYIEDRGKILAAVSHDLKTPITRLRLRTELLDDPAVAARFQADLDEMEAMVQSTLDFMRGTEQAEAVVPVDVSALLESLQEDAAEAGRRVSIHGEVRQPYRGRPLALKRCLVNLLDNAVKYGGEARVGMSDSPAELTLVVADGGPGIPGEMLERVFEPFFRLESSRGRETGGTGLGLGIARNIARSHGGDLVLRNAPGGGLEAVLSLPR